jgi:hemerythrin-like domain-containing protein
VTALDSLRSEHALIASVLDAAERYAKRLTEDESIGLADLGVFAAFITEFAELWHHTKEEDFLLPELVRHGLAWDDGPVAHAMREHEQEAYLGRTLTQLAAQDAPPFGELERRREAIAALRGYVLFQRHHMKEEEEVLYQHAGRLLPEDALDAIDRRCRELESHRFAGKRYEEVRQMAEMLIRRYSA